MALSKRTREQMLALCGEIHDDDGVDPRQFFYSKQKNKNQNRKAIQLCKQVAETLSLVFAGEFDDELLHNLQVVSVDPAPDTSQLSVTVSSDVVEKSVDAHQILDRLHAVAGKLRCDVAAAITRKRAPKLVFRLIGPEPTGEVVS